MHAMEVEMKKAVLDIKLKGGPLLLNRKIQQSANEFMNHQFRTISWWEDDALRTVPLEMVEYFDLREAKDA